MRPFRSRSRMPAATLLAAAVGVVIGGMSGPRLPTTREASASTPESGTSGAAINAAAMNAAAMNAAAMNAAALAWLSERGLIRGVRTVIAGPSARFAGASLRQDPDADAQTGPLIRLVPAPGFVLPEGTFISGPVRFNDAGQVVAILPPASDPCDMLWIADTGDPEGWILICFGLCPPDDDGCDILFGLATLELSCGCLS